MLNRFVVLNFIQENGLKSWHVYDNDNHWFIHSAPAFLKENIEPICCRLICDALNFKHNFQTKMQDNN
jgi:hypothetical protein